MYRIMIINAEMIPVLGIVSSLLINIIHAEMTVCLENEYYIPQTDTCLKCKLCFIGEETIQFQKWTIPVLHKEGPTECRPCVPCKIDTFSDVKAYKCKKCRNCSDHATPQLRGCTAKSDTVCADFSVNVTSSGTSEISTMDSTIQVTTGTNDNEGEAAINIFVIFGFMIPIVVKGLLIIVFLIRSKVHKKDERVYNLVVENEKEESSNLTIDATRARCRFENEYENHAEDIKDIDRRGKGRKVLNEESINRISKANGYTERL